MVQSSRILAYQAFKDSAELTALVGDRIGPASSFDRQSKRPLVAIRAHTGFNVGRRVGRREYMQVWCHDDPGDYLQIDEVLGICIATLEALPHQDNFMEARWIETGVDLRDDLMESIARYCRFQFDFARRETL